MVAPRELGDAERAAILEVCEAAAAAGAGRREAMQALRGGRSDKLRRLGLTACAGHGFLASLDEEETLARIDTLIQEGWIEARRDEDGRAVFVSAGEGGRTP